VSNFHWSRVLKMLYCIHALYIYHCISDLFARYLCECFKNRIQAVKKKKLDLKGRKEEERDMRERAAKCVLGRQIGLMPVTYVGSG